ncbi:unannotated protein [freshwater metagenome]|uniref:Unannotated protein n=1 Tax=freshwater metagenome TaxID=449393 RepID=A0A6J7HF91_9ZZZZ
MHAPEELPGLRALDDAVVVGRREREDLRDGIAGDRLGGGSLPFGGVVHRPDPDDAALAVHEPGHRVVRADGAGIGEGDGRIRVVLDGELAGSRLADEIVVAGPENGEVHRLGALDIRDEQLPGAVRLREVDREAEVDVGVERDRGLAVDGGKGGVHRRDPGRSLNDRVPDEVGERDLAAAGPSEVIVDDDAVIDEQLGRKRSHACRGRDGEAGLHVRHDACGRTAKDRDLIGDRLDRMSRSGRFRNGGCDGRRLDGLGDLGRSGRRRTGHGLGVGRGDRGVVGGRVALEELPPGGVDARLVLEELVVDLIDEPLVRAEPCQASVGGFGRHYRSSRARRDGAFDT